MSAPSTRITLRQAQALFAVSNMCLYLWRTKPAKGRTPLPMSKPLKGEPANTLLVDGEKAVKWANKYGITLATTLDSVIKNVPASEPRGPKPKPEAAPAEKKEVAKKVAAKKSPAVAKKVAAKKTAVVRTRARKAVPAEQAATA